MQSSTPLLARRWKPGKGQRRNLSHVTGLTSLMTSSHSQVTESGRRLKPRQAVPPLMQSLALSLGLAPSVGGLGPSVAHSERLTGWFLSSRSGTITRQHWLLKSKLSLRNGHFFLNSYSGTDSPCLLALRGCTWCCVLSTLDPTLC